MVEKQKKAFDYCTDRIRNMRPLTLGKECKNEYIIIKTVDPDVDGYMTYIKIYYDYCTNIDGCRLGLKDAAKKTKANYKKELVEDFIDGTLYRLIFENGYHPITVVNINHAMLDTHPLDCFKVLEVKLDEDETKV